MLHTSLWAKISHPARLRLSGLSEKIINDNLKIYLAYPATCDPAHPVTRYLCAIFFGDNRF